MDENREQLRGVPSGSECGAALEECRAGSDARVERRKESDCEHDDTQEQL